MSDIIKTAIPTRKYILSMTPVVILWYGPYNLHLIVSPIEIDHLRALFLIYERWVPNRRIVFEINNWIKAGFPIHNLPMEQSGGTNPAGHTHDAFCASRSGRHAPFTPQFVD